MNDLLKIAALIDDTMRYWIYSHPNCKSQEVCETYVLHEVMQETKGHINPSLVQQMIKLHRKPMEDAGFLMQC